MHGPNSFGSQQRANGVDDARVDEVVYLAVQQLERWQPMQATLTGSGCEPGTAPKELQKGARLPTSDPGFSLASALRSANTSWQGGCAGRLAAGRRRRWSSPRVRRVGDGGDAEWLRARISGVQKAQVGRVQKGVRSGVRLLGSSRDKIGRGSGEVRISRSARGALSFWGGIREISSSVPRLLWNRHGQRCREVRVRETARPSTGPLGGMKGGPSLLRGPPYNGPGREVSNTRQSRASVGRVPLRLDMASTPPDAGRE